MLIGYARVSTQDQNPELQLDALNAAGCEKVFTEKASGAQRDRPQLKAALDYIRKGDTLVVWKLDRLARSLKQLIETIEDLEQRKIGFKSLTESIDTTTAGGKLIFHIFGGLAEFERSIIRERTNAGLQAARERGRTGGRPPALSDKDLKEAKVLLRDPEITVEQVARRLGVAPSTLYPLPPYPWRKKCCKSGVNSSPAIGSVL
jgi:DNA invertase Pin-like site-specific DNA recombinase